MARNAESKALLAEATAKAQEHFQRAEELLKKSDDAHKYPSGEDAANDSDSVVAAAYATRAIAHVLLGFAACGAALVGAIDDDGG